MYSNNKLRRSPSPRSPRQRLIWPRIMGNHNINTSLLCWCILLCILIVRNGHRALQYIVGVLKGEDSDSLWKALGIILSLTHSTNSLVSLYFRSRLKTPTVYEEYSESLRPVPKSRRSDHRFFNSFFFNICFL